MDTTTQTYANHAKFVPLFHYVLLPILAVNLFAMGYNFVREPDMFHGWSFVMSIAFVLSALFARVFALKAQDRIIRIEERFRLRELLPADLKARVLELTPEQLIGLRFASDAELPELAATVLRDNVQKRDDINKMVKSWRADTHQL